MVDDGKRRTQHHIDNLKDFSLGEKIIGHLEVNPVIIQNAEQHFGEIKDLDYQAIDFDVFSPVWDDKIVWIGYPGRDQLDHVITYIAKRKCQVAYVIVPELPFEDWFKTLDAIPDALWFGVRPGDGPDFWLAEDKRVAMTPPITWFIVKVIGQ